MLKHLMFTVGFGVVLVCAAPATMHAINWTGWFIDGKSAETLPFWDGSETKVIDGQDQAKFALIENLKGDDGIMKVHLDDQGNAESLAINKIYSYASTDFKIYESKVPDYIEEQELVGHWINSLIKADPRNHRFASITDKFFRRLEPLAKKEPWVVALQRELMATRLGISPKILEEHPDFEAFVKANSLYKHLPYHNQKVEVNAEDMPELLVDGMMKPWSEIKDNIQVNQQGKLTNYFYTYEGLVPGQPWSVLRPFKKVDPKLYHHQYTIEVITIDTVPPHNWVRLIDPDGNLYSIGYWGATPINSLMAAVKHLKPEEGRATSPDLMEIAGDPDKVITTPIQITQEQFEETLAYIRDYQREPGYYQILSIGGENCATFLRNLTDRIGIKIQSSSWLRPFNNPYDVMAWQREQARDLQGRGS